MPSNIEINYHKNTHIYNNNKKNTYDDIMIVEVLKAAQNSKS